MVERFANGCPHQMEMEREGSFQIHNLRIDDRCIYHIMVSQILPVMSLTSIIIERARYLYAF
jgi:hypothetical protein